MDLLSDHCPANIWTDTTLDLVYLPESIKICVCFTKYLPPDKWGEKREESDAFLSCCVCVCEGWAAWFFSFSRIMAGSQLFSTSEIQVSAYLFVNNNNNKSSSPNSSLYITFSFNVFKFKFCCFVCKYVDPGTVINEQKVTVQGSDSV